MRVLCEIVRLKGWTSPPRRARLQGVLNQNANSQTASSVVDDTNGCTAGQNAIFTIPGGWSDACQAGVQGDWVMFVEYRCMGTVSVDEKDWGSVKLLYSSDAQSDGETDTP